MTHEHHLLLYQTVTPLHVGCGQDVGVVDLPVIRERTTGYPFIPGSGTRGALRAAFDLGDKAETDQWRDRLFGPEEIGADDTRYAGSVSIHDAKLLLLPVRSTPEVYVWITAPTPLRRYVRDVEAFGLDAEIAGLKPDLERLLAVTVPDDGFLGRADLGIDEGSGPVLYLEEYAYAPVGEAEGLAAAREELARWSGEIAGALGLREELPGRVVVVSDAAFDHFCRFATVVQQHNKLTSAKTVAGGALFSTEAVPPDAVFHGLVGAAESRWTPPEEPALAAGAVLDQLWKGYGPGAGTGWSVHLGGGESTGLGVTRVVRAAGVGDAG